MQPTDYKIPAGTVAPRAHPFIHHPNTTLIFMSLPVLLSLIAEPLTGLVDTAFIARLGSVSLAALGVGTVGLSGIFWIFNFLGIGTQTEISQAFGRQSLRRVTEIGGLALALAVIFGLFFSTAFTLVIVPVLYDMLSDLETAVLKKLGQFEEEPEQAVERT